MLVNTSSGRCREKTSLQTNATWNSQINLCIPVVRFADAQADLILPWSIMLQREVFTPRRPNHEKQTILRSYPHDQDQFKLIRIDLRSHKNHVDSVKLVNTAATTQCHVDQGDPDQVDKLIRIMSLV